MRGLRFLCRYRAKYFLSWLELAKSRAADKQIWRCRFNLGLTRIFNCPFLASVESIKPELQSESFAQVSELV